jgi:hypothetical protein
LNHHAVDKKPDSVAEGGSLSAIQKKWQYLAIGGGALVIIILLIVIFGSPGPDISGTYELLVAGQKTETVIDIASANDSFQIKFLEKDVVRSQYLLPKPRTNRFTIEKTVDGKPGDRFDLEVVNGGLKGTADITTLAKGIDVYFRKVQ